MIVNIPIGKDLPAFAADISLLSADIMFRLATTVGLKNKLLDARAGCYPTKKDKDGNTVTNEDYSVDNAVAYVQKTWDNLVAGEWGRERGSGSGLNELDARILKLAEAAVRAAIKGANIKLKDVADDVFDATVADYIAHPESGPLLRTKAEELIAAEKAAPKPTIDLSRLGLKV